MEPIGVTTIWPRLKEAYALSKKQSTNQIVAESSLTEEQNALIQGIISQMAHYLTSEESLIELKTTGHLYSAFLSVDNDTYFRRKEKILDLSEIQSNDLKNALIKKITKEFDPKKVEILAYLQTGIVVEVIISNLTKTLVVDSSGEVVNELEGTEYHHHPSPKNAIQQKFHTAEKEYDRYQVALKAVNEIIPAVFSEDHLKDFCTLIRVRDPAIPSTLTIKFNQRKGIIPQLKGRTIKEIVVLIKIISEQNILPMKPTCKFTTELETAAMVSESTHPHFMGSENGNIPVIVTYTLFDDRDKEKI